MWLHAGAWLLPTTDAAQDALSKMRDAVRNALQVWQGVESTYFSVNYTFNGSDPVPLPGIFMTPDASKRLPLVIQGTGFDYPKEVCALLLASQEGPTATFGQRLMC